MKPMSMVQVKYIKLIRKKYLTDMWETDII